MTMVLLWAVHISDGVLSPPWLTGGFVGMAGLMAVGAWRIRDEEIPLTQGNPQAMLSQVFPSSGYQLRHSPVGFRSQWHCPPKPQWGFILGGEMEIGRTPVREAIKRLALENLVTVFPRRGTFASEINITDLADISDVRMQLEGHAAYRAAQRITPALREELDYAKWCRILAEAGWATPTYPVEYQGEGLHQQAGPGGQRGAGPDRRRARTGTQHRCVRDRIAAHCTRRVARRNRLRRADRNSRPVAGSRLRPHQRSHPFR